MQNGLDTLMKQTGWDAYNVIWCKKVFRKVWWYKVEYIPESSHCMWHARDNKCKLWCEIKHNLRLFEYVKGNDHHLWNILREMIKCSTLRWFGHLERMKWQSYIRKADTVGVKGNPPLKLENRVLEYLRGRQDGERERTRVCKVSEVYG